MDSLKQFDYNINSTTATNQEEQEVSEHLDVEVEDDIMDLKPEYPMLVKKVLKYNVLLR